MWADVVGVPCTLVSGLHSLQTLHPLASSSSSTVPTGLVIDPLLEALIDAAFARTTWEAFQEVWTKLPLTLVHGDFHPVSGNSLYVYSAREDAAPVLYKVHIYCMIF